MLELAASPRLQQVGSSFQWRITVWLKVANEHHGAENSAMPDPFSLSCSVHDKPDVVPPFKGPNCDLLIGAPAVQFFEDFVGHPTLGDSRRRPNLVLVEFDGVKCLLKAHNSMSALEEELLGWSTELN